MESKITIEEFGDYLQSDSRDGIHPDRAVALTSSMDPYRIVSIYISWTPNGPYYKIEENNHLSDTYSPESIPFLVNSLFNRRFDWIELKDYYNIIYRRYLDPDLSRVTNWLVPGMTRLPPPPSLDYLSVDLVHYRLSLPPTPKEFLPEMVSSLSSPRKAMQRALEATWNEFQRRLPILIETWRPTSDEKDHLTTRIFTYSPLDRHIQQIILYTDIPYKDYISHLRSEEQKERRLRHRAIHLKKNNEDHEIPLSLKIRLKFITEIEESVNRSLF